jgi:hypothetical protein
MHKHWNRNRLTKEIDHWMSESICVMGLVKNKEYFLSLQYNGEILSGIHISISMYLYVYISHLSKSFGKYKLRYMRQNY